ncbi:MAG: nuclear transport factor 2 family protein [Thermoanaerobaculia bacterium]|nr:nuclear transport factor 2 family protein [Thermoanaerobaculia bacterium]
MKRAALVLVALWISTLSAMADPSDSSYSDLEESLREMETAFAKTMEERDFGAFSSFIAEDAIFSTPRATLRGRAEILAVWKTYFETEAPPFSWQPERVHVLRSRTLGGTTGPILDPDGNVIGQFVSTWKRAPSGAWKIVLDLAPNCR